MYNAILNEIEFKIVKLFSYDDSDDTAMLFVV